MDNVNEREERAFIRGGGIRPLRGVQQQASAPSLYPQHRGMNSDWISPAACNTEELFSQPLHVADPMLMQDTTSCIGGVQTGTESGWTDYFSWSSSDGSPSAADTVSGVHTDLAIDESLAKQARICLIADHTAAAPAVGKNHTLRPHHCYKPSIFNVDRASSMASDASSGPSCSFLSSQKEIMRLVDASQESEDALQHARNDTQACKKMRTQLNAPSYSCLESTKMRRKLQTSDRSPHPLVSEQRPRVAADIHTVQEVEHFGTPYHDSGRANILRPSVAAVLSSEPWQSSETLDHRLAALQTLIPNSLQLSKEEMLQATAEYVRSLQLKVKLFEKTVNASGKQRTSPEL